MRPRYKAPPILTGLLIVLVGALILGIIIGYTYGNYSASKEKDSLALDNKDFILQVVSLSYELEKLSQRYEDLGLVIECESSGNHEGIWGDCALPYPAYGIAQFQKRTFDFLKRLAERKDLSYWDKNDQVWLLNWAMDNGFGHYWTCYKLKLRGG